MPGRPLPPRQEPPTSWTPYVVGFVLLCMGPLRPLVWELLSAVYEQLQVLLLGGPIDPEEVPWYDQ